MNDRGLKVLEQYDLEIISTKRGRGSYICETDRGWKLLCDCESSEKKMEFENQVLHALKDNGYPNVDAVLENKEGHLVSKDRDDNRYVVKDWYLGRECNASSERDVLTAVENLARLHQCLRFPDAEKTYQGNTLAEEFGSRTRELRKVRTFMRKREPKHPFEQLFLSSYSCFYEQAQQVEQQLDRLNFEDEYRKQIEQGLVCHGEYNYHHVLFLEQGVATTGFERCRFDFQIRDLYQFMRKILEKQDWDPGLGMKMLRQYERICPLQKSDHKILFCLMLYPEKFWKLANHYYGSRKAWIPGRYLQKLQMLNRQQEQRNNFLKLLE